MWCHFIIGYNLHIHPTKWLQYNKIRYVLGRFVRVYVHESNIEKIRLIAKLILPKRSATEERPALGIEADILFASGRFVRSAQKDSSAKPDPSAARGMPPKKERECYG
jgi:hypothetical protein